MTTAYTVVALALLVSLCGGLYQLIRGPTPGDRMLACQLFGTVAVAVLILIGVSRNDSSLIDIALIFALLATVTMVAFIRCAWPEEDIDGSRR